jgi:diguanylate cyclase (GGDEF)-like protein
MRRGALILCLLVALQVPALQAQTLPDTQAQAEARLSMLLLRAFDQPDDVLKTLRAEAPGGAAEVSQLHAQAIVLTEAGRLESALALASKLDGLPEGRARAAVVRAVVADRRGSFAQAVESAKQAWSLVASRCEQPTASQPAGQPGRLNGCDVAAAWSALRLLQRERESAGALAEAASLAQQGFNLASSVQDVARAVISAGALAVLNQQLDQAGQARRWLTEGRALAEGEPLLLSRMMVFEAGVATVRGDSVTQRRGLEEALQLAQSAGAKRVAAQVQTNLTDLHMHSGRPSEALAMARQALPVVLEFKDLRLERTLRHNKAVALIMLGQLEAARRELARSQALGETQQEPARRAAELREVGEAWAAAGQPREAIAIFHQERALTAKTHALNRDAQLQALRIKFDSEREQRNLDLLTRETHLKDQQLLNHDLARKAGLALGLLLLLSVVLVGVMLKRVRAANRQLKANQRLLRAQSERDPLTDLANRRHFQAVMAEQAPERLDGALMMIDIDHFKHVNDRYGHGAGDAVICEVGRRVKHAMRAEDLVVRWGGEEFLVFAPHVSSEQLQLLAERVLNSVGGSAVRTESGELRVTVSIGFAGFPLPANRLPLHWEQAVECADMALYIAKSQGRNRAVGIEAVEAPDSQALKAIQGDLESACSKGQVRLKHINGPS